MTDENISYAKANVPRKGWAKCRRCYNADQSSRRQARRGEPGRHLRDCQVYFIGDGAGHVKIGHTQREGLEFRLQALQCGNALELTLLAAIDGSPVLERELHARFSVYRVRGEWFKLVPEIADFIGSI